VLTRIRLINFRRHVDTALDFSDDAQIIAITGRNGAGKSSLLEAISFALYGEGRNGRRNLDRLVRRGGEHEGMQVEIEFNLGDVAYAVTRRLEKKRPSATMFANGNLIMQSPDGVTAEVTKVLGMDAVGYRLAVIAQQFDVDGLADLTPARRRATITRLLRQDAVTKAKDAAAGLKVRELDIVRAFGSGPDLESLTAELTDATAAAAEAQAAVLDSRAVLTSLDADLAGTADVAAQWQSAQIAAARADATATAALAEVDRLSAELASIVVPAELPAPSRPVSEIAAELSQLNISIATAEAAKELAAAAAQTRSDLDRATARLTAIEAETAGATPASLALELSQTGSAVTAAETALSSAREEVDATRGRWHEVNAALSAVRAAETAAGGVGDVCDACEQPVPVEHRHRQAAGRRQRLTQLTADLAAIGAAGATAAAAVTTAEAVVRALTRDREGLVRRRGSVEALLKERTELTRRIAAYTARLDRIVADPVDAEALYVRKGLLECEKATAEQADQVSRLRAGALERRGRVQTQLTDARARLDAAAAERAAAEPGADLRAAYRVREEKLTVRGEEAQLLAAVEIDAATTAERVASVTRAVAAARLQADSVLEHRRSADRAAKAAQLLELTAGRLATRVRPALEGEISALLMTLSEGRFTAVEVSDSYEIRVQDDGTFHPLSELSGGERVLVALAVRLALATVVAGRHASGGVGYLVLDEIFGSQDLERRDSIMAGLRGLRAVYGQIFLISHVGGLEEAADRVLDVSVRDEDGHRIADVVAA
jgi:exonuclease SbcC